ncbi:hypothetical protein [Xanthomonas citri]|uniref:hypothetical protein n=1 Tax=Xanthomonas citri TaxID=346 RepID=UPI00103D4187|nr:hypothetical protein [Xanthomonas citri]
MGILLILPLLVSGYIFCIRNPLIRYRLHQYDGQLLYFRVALCGLICFFIALIAISVVTLSFSRVWQGHCIGGPQGLCWSEFSTDYIKEISLFLSSLYSPWSDASRIYSFFILVGIVTMLVPYPLSGLILKLYERDEEERLGRKIGKDDLEHVILRDSLTYRPMSQALLEAAARTMPVMVVMEDRKFYVGTVSSLGTPTEASGADDDFGLRPFMGGYCDKDTLELVIDPRYSEDISVIEKPNGKSVTWTPSVILKQSAIISFTRMPLMFDKRSIFPFPHRLMGENFNDSKIQGGLAPESMILPEIRNLHICSRNIVPLFLGVFLTSFAINVLGGRKR